MESPQIKSISIINLIIVVSARYAFIHPMKVIPGINWDTFFVLATKTVTSHCVRGFEIEVPVTHVAFILGISIMTCNRLVTYFGIL